MALFDDENEDNKTPTLLADAPGTLDDITDINEPAEVLTEVVAAEGVDEAPKPIKAPSRYAGKTQDELTQMLEDAQAHIGRQGLEIGEVRKLADDLVKKSLIVSPKEVTPPAQQEEDEDDFFTDPAAAVARAVNKHPAVAAAKEAAALAARERSTSQVLASHPDMTQVIGSPEFAEWVKASPMRVRMYALADQYDSEAAVELISNFKMSSSAKVDTSAQVTASAAKVASTLAAASVGMPAAAASATPSKKYRRSDIMRLMSTDPSRYEAMADEILKAYADGRVV